MAKGFGGLPGNMQGLVQQAKKMQEELKKAQENAKTITEEFSSGGGMVKAVANGEGQLLSVAIEKDVVDPNDVEMLQDLVLAACNGALSKAQEKAQEAIGKITGGMNIPGMF